MKAKFYDLVMENDGGSSFDINAELFAELYGFIDVEQTLTERVALENTHVAISELERVRNQITRVKERIINENMGLVVNYAARFFEHATPEHVEDYIAAGIVGLLQAIYTYDSQKGKFSTWAYKPIMREVQAAVHWTEFPDHSERQFTTRHSVLKAKRELEEQNPNFMPSVEQIAERAGVEIEHTASVLSRQSTMPVNAETLQEQLNEIRLPSEVSADFAELEIDRLWLQYLSEATATVPIDELLVLLRHEGLDGWPAETFEKIGTWLGIGRETVRQMDARARQRIEDNGYRVPKPME
jgi:RNA polymerase primary sigma factor